MPTDPAAWMRFAEADLRVARMVFADADAPNRIACFHAQQAAEKALKAALVVESTPFRKTHDIVVLIGLVHASLSSGMGALDVLVLQPWAVDGRYPSDLPDATQGEALEAVATAASIIEAVKEWLERR